MSEKNLRMQAKSCSVHVVEEISCTSTAAMLFAASTSGTWCGLALRHCCSSDLDAKACGACKKEPICFGAAMSPNGLSASPSSNLNDIGTSAATLHPSTSYWIGPVTL